MKHKNFPVFLDIQGKNVLVIGGGKVALRRVKTLAKFDFNIKIVTLEACLELCDFCKEENIEIKIADFCENDLNGIFMLLLCTNDREFNDKVAKKAKKEGILTSVCDKKEQCDFYFPAVCVTEDLILGLVGNGSDHKKVSETMSKIRKNLEENFED